MDQNLLRKIVDSAKIKKGDKVLEVGPGRGHLTGRILERGATVIAVEIDKNFAQILRKRYFLLLGERFYLLEGDYLKLNLKELLDDLKSEVPLKFLSNIPYSITSPILLKLVKEKNFYNEIYITLQKEVAERVKASPGSDPYGSLSIYMQYHFEPEILFYIKRGSFRPVPKVNSAFMRLKPIRVPPVKLQNEDFFFNIVRIAFRERRKKLRTILKKHFGSLPFDEIEKISEISLDLRGETLSLQQFAKLSDTIFEFSRNIKSKNS